MTDILARLRDRLPLAQEDPVRVIDLATIRMERRLAADEIERLRKIIRSEGYAESVAMGPYA